MAERTADADRRVRSLQELPPLPGSAQRLLDVLARDDLDMHDLARAIEEVPALAARVVGLAGAAYFGARAPVRSVFEAIVRVLGLQLVRNIALGIALTRSFDLRRCPRFSPEQYWTSALLTAGLARRLAPSVREAAEVIPDAAYLCGLLHNLGLLALLQVAPGEMERALERASEDPDRPLAEFEIEEVGFSHGEAGKWLAERWQLPDAVAATMAHHPDPDYRGPGWPEAVLTGISAQWARQCVAGVKPPWLEPAALDALGIDAHAFRDGTACCADVLEDVQGLARMLGGRG